MTTKQNKAIEIIMKSNGTISTSKAMQQAGYSPATSNQPGILTKSKAYQTIVVPKLKAAGVTLDQYINNVGKAMQANKQVTVEGDIITTEEPDLAMRLSGNKQAEKLLRIDELVGTSSSDNPLDPEDLASLAAASDEIELTKVVFKRNT